MAVSRVALILAAMLLLCCGCAGRSLPLPRVLLSEAQQKLADGIQGYEEANYQDAALLLQEALSKGLSSKSDQIKAHKYLAFIHCISERKRECAGEFRKIFELDPHFELQPAEEGHPLWGPVYRNVRNAKSKPPAKRLR